MNVTVRAICRAAWGALLVVAIAACGAEPGTQVARTGDSSTEPLTVFAAASLTDVFQRLDDDATYQFAASDALAIQLREGAEADVFAAADTALPDELHREGLVEKPVVFAGNRVVLAVRKDADIAALGDLARKPEARFVMAADGVPLGDYTVKVLTALGQKSIISRASSRERDAKAVMAKVKLGEADAGFVYATDIRSAGNDVAMIELPATPANDVKYGIAIVKDAANPRSARRFLNLITSPTGQRALEAAGFATP